MNDYRPSEPTCTCAHIGSGVFARGKDGALHQPGCALVAQVSSNPRAAFEKWLQDVHGLSSEWQDERNCYAQFPAHLAWCAWQAAAKKPSDETNDDTARMDWLQARSDLFANIDRITSVNGKFNGYPTLREAIDNARRPSVNGSDGQS